MVNDIYYLFHDHVMSNLISNINKNHNCIRYAVASKWYKNIILISILKEHLNFLIHFFFTNTQSDLFVLITTAASESYCRKKEIFMFVWKCARSFCGNLISVSVKNESRNKSGRATMWYQSWWRFGNFHLFR